MKSKVGRKTGPALTWVGVVAVLMSLLSATLALVLQGVLAGRFSWGDLRSLPELFLFVGLFGGMGAQAAVMLLVVLLAAMERRGTSRLSIHASGITLGTILGIANALLSFLVWGKLLIGPLILSGAAGGATAGACVAIGVLRRRVSS